MAAITLRGIEKRYEGTPGGGGRGKSGGVHVVKHIDLDIADGEFVVLVGPSGCGKSTTLRMIAGLETITGGELFIDGKKSNDVPPGDRDLAMVFQSYALYPHMTVRENIAFGLKVRKLPSTEIEARTKDAAAILGLEELLERKPKQLSGGQRQRVAMARAIVRRPKAFLFDEPLSNLDAKLRMEVRAEIAALRRRFGTTTVYVTHDQVEAMTLADRIVVLNEGVVQQVGAPLELYQKPANRFVATFLGTPTMGILEVSTLTPAIAGPLAPAGGAAQVGVRPHDARAVATSSAPAPGYVRLGEIEVDLVERLGQESFAFGKIGGARVGALVDEAAPGSAALKPGSKVALDAPRAKLTFFAVDGKRIDA